MNMLTLLLGNQSQPTRCGYLHQNSWPWGKSLLQFYWLAKEYKEHCIIQKHPNTAQSPTSRLWYLSNYHDASQAHMHPLHKLGNANIVATTIYNQTQNSLPMEMLATLTWQHPMSLFKPYRMLLVVQGSCSVLHNDTLGFNRDIERW